MSSNQHFPSQRSALLLTVLLLLALLGYYLPWLNAAAAGLSANAFDLAEWLSLSPLVRGANPQMLTPFLLRLGLSLLAVLFALNARHSRGWLRWLNAILSLLLTLTLFPPIEFIRAPGGTDDPNYRQLFGLLLGTLIADLAIMAVPRFARWWRWLNVLCDLLLIVGSVWGATLAFAVLASEPLKMATPLGIGVIWLIIAVIGHQIAVWHIPNS